MDPLTHGLLGGAVAQVAFRNRVTAATTAAGALGAMAPDLDILIHSRTNPLLMYEFHRSFTHSLVFIPLGGLLIGWLVWRLRRRKPPLRDLLLAAILGYATHGLLDACTSYGTQLFWPFSNARVSWDFIFILDPFYSLILLIGLALSLRRGLGSAALIALLVSTAYLGLGAWQHVRALALQREIAASRGHAITTGRVIPAPGPHLLWRSIYLTQGELHVDALRVGYGGVRRFWPGGALAAFSLAQLAGQIPAPSVLARDLQLFDWFTEGYAARLGQDPLEVGDLRFSALPDGLRPLWGIRVDPRNPERHVKRLRFPWRGEARWNRLWEMLWDRAPGGEIPVRNTANKWLKRDPPGAMLAPTLSSN